MPKTELIREKCRTCGMTATLDPELHEQQYGHRPYVMREVNGERKLLGFDYRTYRWEEVTCPACIEAGTGCKAHFREVHTAVDDADKDA